MRLFGFNDPNQGYRTGAVVATAAFLFLTRNFPMACEYDNSFPALGCSLLARLILAGISTVPFLGGAAGVWVSEALQADQAPARRKP